MALDDRLSRLLFYLDVDPANPALLADAAEAALAAGAAEQALGLIDRLAAQGPLPDPLRNIEGLAAMAARQFDRAAAVFGDLATRAVGGAAVRFNLGWTQSLAGDHDAALATLDEATVDQLPQAAMLKLQSLHRLGRFDEAAALLPALLERHGDDAGLLAAASTLAIDVEDEALARRCAQAAGDHPDALTTLGTLDLGEQDPAAAMARFEAALAVRQNNPRAWIGKGLARLMQDAADVGSGDVRRAAAADLDRGAEQFGDHIGSWIAAGWGHLVAGDKAAARARFERALGIDESFGESHGSLAVLDMLDGDTESARRRATTARRLDRESFSAALADALIAQAGGNAARAQAIVDLAMRTPIGAGQRTLATALAGLAAGHTRH